MLSDHRTRITTMTLFIDRRRPDPVGAGAVRLGHAELAGHRIRHLHRIASTAGQWIVVLAFRYADASVLAPFSYSQLVWVSVLGFFVFGEIPDVWTVVGAGFICGERPLYRPPRARSPLATAAGRRRDLAERLSRRRCRHPRLFPASIPRIPVRQEQQRPGGSVDARCDFPRRRDRRRYHAGTVPGAGQVLVKTLACGICGSDLHARKHAHRMVGLAKHFPAASRWICRATSCSATSSAARCWTTVRAPRASSSRHQRVLAAGAADAAGTQGIGYSNDNVGAYAERMLLSEPLLLEVPNGLRPSMRR
jgi:hypothetical protein